MTNQKPDKPEYDPLKDGPDTYRLAELTHPTPVDKSLREELKQILFDCGCDYESLGNKGDEPDLDKHTQSILQALSNRLPEEHPEGWDKTSDKDNDWADGWNKCLSEVRAIIEDQ